MAIPAGVGYINEDKSKVFNFEIDNNKTIGEAIKLIGPPINSYLDNILQSLGLIRADNHGNHNSLDINFGTGHGVIGVHFINCYTTINDKENYLVLDTRVLLTAKANNLSSYSSDSLFKILKDGPAYGVDLYISNIFFFSRAIPVDGQITDTRKNFISSFILDGAFSSYTTFSQLNNDYLSFTGEIPFRIIGNNYGKYFSLLKNENVIPNFGVSQINNKNYLVCFLPNKRVDTSYTDSLDYYNPVIDAYPVNILIMNNEDYRYGTANIFSNYTFYDLNNKMPILPIFASSTTTINPTEYDFNIPLMGIAQTSKNFFDLKDSRYQLNGKIYRNLGGCYLFEEGDEKINK